ncbi:NmrA/HSCARG family protein [Ramlibacter albus]|uniref:NmrA/HSCARG family protein n=1 Tax=Ramlibacter albus TaxID=2079448 RepID=A0A923MC30_9BURK|nr:NmrA/HSCARG family protein [Ramlibacter albus]MBC5767431.1 NmrA/HSCARG family protein [Ramlibacter albus]
MTSKKIIAVFGATGAQGGGLVRALLADRGGAFTVRALTRKPGSPAAQALREAGAEVVYADQDQPDTLVAALAGAHGAFCVTNFWEHFSPEREYAQAKAMAEAAAAAGVKHVIWSTLEDTRQWVAPGSGRMPLLMGKYNVPHFDAKGEADLLFDDLGVPTTWLVTSFYWENLIHFGMGPKRGADGRLKFTLPMGTSKLPAIAAGDIGVCALELFYQGEAVIGERIAIAGEHLSGAEMAAQLSVALGEPVDHHAASWDEYRAYDFPGADDLGNMFQFNQEFEQDFRAVRDVERTRQLHPGLQDFAQWLRANAGAIPKG